MVRHRMMSLIACCCLSGFLAGCNRQPIIVETVLPESQLRLMKINTAYNNFVDRFGRAPRGEQDLLPMLVTENATENPSVDDLETLLNSNSGEPFVICYGVNPMRELPWAKSTPVLAYEHSSSQQPVTDKRWVLTAPGAILQMTEAEFRAASFPPGHEPMFETEFETELDGESEGAP